ncbi:MAG: diheme cytochrome C [Cyanothece sp. SIO1E1]|nr:diheme cytochrome C [Cyanothece sp. SIO1E1]
MFRFFKQVFQPHTFSASRVSRRHRKKFKRSPLVLLLFILFWSLCMGWGLAQAVDPSAVSNLRTVDPVPERHQLGQKLYLENCGTCHVALPPAVMPTETWRQLLLDPQHYGVQLKPLSELPLNILWRYITFASRPHFEGESVPFYIARSRYFKALHPQIEFPEAVSVGGCVTCHPSVSRYDFRSLSAEWLQDEA